MGLELLTERVRKTRRVNARHRLADLLHAQLADLRFREGQIVGSYVVDFICIERSLIVELVGNEHVLGLPMDIRRKQRLESLGFRVLQVWDSEVMSDPNTVFKSVLHALQPHCS